MNSFETLHDLVALLWPNRCLVCARGLARAELCSRCIPSVPSFAADERCQRCWSELAQRTGGAPCPACLIAPPLFRFQRFLWSYADAIAEAIRIMKYRPSKRLTSALAHISAPVIGAIFPSSDWAVIIPMPATFASLRQRGFNQCEELARIIGAELDVPTDGKALSHRGSKTPQASLPLDERLRNVRGVFHAKSERVIGKRCLLIDDVATSGATSAAAAYTLLTEGAASVDLITLARSTAWNEFRHAVAQRYPADPASRCAPGQP